MGSVNDYFNYKSHFRYIVGTLILVKIFAKNQYVKVFREMLVQIFFITIFLIRYFSYP